MKKRIESLENFQSKINESYYANDNGVIVDKDVNVIRNCQENPVCLHRG